MTVRVVSQPLASNTYLCPLSEPGTCAVVDPGLDGDAVLRAIEELGLEPRAILCTHGHFDHLGSAHALQERYGAPLYLHGADVKLARSANFLLMACRLDRRITVPRIDVTVSDGAEVVAGGDVFRFVHTPGHTPGSCCIELGDALFTGDTMYTRAVGLVSLPGEDPAQLRESVLGLWDRLPDSTWIYPGHGDDACFGDVKDANRALREFLALEPAA